MVPLLEHPRPASLVTSLAENRQQRRSCTVRQFYIRETAGPLLSVLGIRSEEKRGRFMAGFRILTKIFAIIVVLSLITGVMAWLGVSSLHSVSDHSDTMKRSAERALLATRANNNVVAMNRAEFRSAIDPRDENRLAARVVIDEQVKQLDERLAEIAKTTDEKTQALLPPVRSALSTYQSQMKQTLQSVDEAKSVDISQPAMKLRDAAMKSQAAAEDLRVAIRAVATRMDERVIENNKAAE